MDEKTVNIKSCNSCVFETHSITFGCLCSIGDFSVANMVGMVHPDCPLRKGQIKVQLKDT